MEYLCLRCNSNKIGFIFDDDSSEIFFVKELIRDKKVILSNSIDDSSEIFFVKELIRDKKVILSNSIDDYYKNTGGPNWMCYDCHDCGVVLY